MTAHRHLPAAAASALFATALLLTCAPKAQAAENTSDTVNKPNELVQKKEALIVKDTVAGDAEVKSADKPDDDASAETIKPEKATAKNIKSEPGESVTPAKEEPAKSDEDKTKATYDKTAPGKTALDKSEKEQDKDGDKAYGEKTKEQKSGEEQEDPERAHDEDQSEDKQPEEKKQTTRTVVTKTSVVKKTVTKPVTQQKRAALPQTDNQGLLVLALGAAISIIGLGLLHKKKA